MHISIEYCMQWNYEPKATGLAAAIRSEFPDATLDLIPGGGGNFIVIADGEQLWHKLQMGDEFPESEVILQKLRW